MEDSLNCFFGIEVDKNKSQKVIPEIGFLHISQAALATPAAGKSSLRVTVEGKSYTVGTLSPEKGTYHMALDMNFMPGVEVEFSVVGEGNTAMHLTGYYELDDDDEDFDGNVDLGDSDEEEEEIPEGKPKAPAAESKPVVVKEAKPVVTAPSSDDDDSSDDDEEEEDEEIGSANEEQDSDEEDSEIEDDDEELPSDDDEEEQEDEMPQKKSKGQHGNSFNKPSHNKPHQQHHHQGKDFHRKPQQGGQGRGFGGNKFNRGGRGGNQGFRDNNRFDGNRKFDRQGGQNRGGHRGGNRFDRGGQNRGGFRGRR